MFSSNKGRGAHLLFSPNGGAYLRAALMRVNMVIGNVPSLRARISAAALINFLSQLLRLFQSDAYSHKYGNWYLKSLLHLGQNVITFRTLFFIRSCQLCKPEATSRVCIIVSNSPNPSSVYIKLFKHRIKVFYCLNIAFLQKILLLCRLQAIYL